MQNPQKPRRLFGIIIIIIGVLIALLSSTFLKDWLIISFGVRVQAFIIQVGLAITIGGIIGVLIKAAPRLYHKFQQHHEQQAEQAQAKFQAQQSSDPNNPTVIRQLLLRLRKEAPQHAPLIDSFIEQMDRMDDIQARQHRLIAENDAIYLQNIEEVLGNAELRLCSNLRKFANLCIAVDYPPRPAIDRVYGDNETILKKCANLIEVSANYINNYNSGGDPSHDEVDRWCAQLEESLREELTIPSAF